LIDENKEGKKLLYITVGMLFAHFILTFFKNNTKNEILPVNDK
jgi:hypothetical protein